MDSNMGKANNGGGAMAGSGGISSGGAVQGGGPSAISENGAGNQPKWSQKSDGEDDDDDDEDHSPDSRSLGSTSEQSLTSPAGFSSLNSLGNLKYFYGLGGMNCFVTSMASKSSQFRK